MNALNFAIIGFGKMGQIRFNTIPALPGCRVVCVSESDPAAKIPDGIPNVADPVAIFKRADVDAVVICTPNHLLKDLTGRALQAGKHVFCEKPPGRNVRELQAMVEAEQLPGRRKLMFGFNHRHHESMLHAKKLIDSGEYGRILWTRPLRQEWG